MRLWVLLWPVPGREQALHDYEDAVLALLPEHGGALQAREIVDRYTDGEPLEVQLISLPDEPAMQSFLADPRRTAREAERAACLARTRLLRVRATLHP